MTSLNYATQNPKAQFTFIYKTKHILPFKSAHRTTKYYYYLNVISLKHFASSKIQISLELFSQSIMIKSIL